MKTITTIAVSFGVLTTAALAQTYGPNFHPVQQFAPASSADQIATLQKQVAQLTSDVQSLKSQLAEVNKSAGDANIKSGIATIWINNNGDKLLQTASWVDSNGVNILNVVKAYPTHTHGYNGHSLGFQNVGCDPGQGGYCSYINKWTETNEVTTPPK